MGTVPAGLGLAGNWKPTEILSLFLLRREMCHVL